MPAINAPDTSANVRMDALHWLGSWLSRLDPLLNRTFRGEQGHYVTRGVNQRPELSLDCAGPLTRAHIFLSAHTELEDQQAALFGTVAPIRGNNS